MKNQPSGHTSGDIPACCVRRIMVHPVHAPSCHKAPSHPSFLSAHRQCCMKERDLVTHTDVQKIDYFCWRKRRSKSGDVFILNRTAVQCWHLRFFGQAKSRLRKMNRVGQATDNIKNMKQLMISEAAYNLRV